MTVATPRSVDRLETLPDELESPRAKLVYLTLSVTDGATLDELHRTLDCSKITLLSVLDALHGRGLVEETGDGYAALS